MSWPTPRSWRYVPDPVTLFERLARRPWAVFLDSGPPPDEQPRDGFDLFSSDPRCTLVSRGRSTEITTNGHLTRSNADPLDLLRQQLRAHRPTDDDADDDDDDDDPGNDPGNDDDPGRRQAGAELPWCGGAIGSFGYELGSRLADIPAHPDPSLYPEMAVGIYDWGLLMDHRRRRGWLIGEPPTAVAALLRAPDERWPLAPERGFDAAAGIQVDLDRQAYRTAFDRIQQYLTDGDCYQVNLARCFHAAVTGDPWPAYRRLRRLSPAPYGAYLSTPYGELLCNSPEQFLRLRADRVSTRPIKGTRRRDPDPDRDRDLARELRSSSKDRAENIMIVDLLRNDLGRVCRPGSIRVDGLCQLQSFATVHHLVSTIHGQLAADHDALDLLRATLPGGSITGAPKHRAMQIIRELEPGPREVYCGSIAALDWRGTLHANIAIRTLVHQHGTVRFRAGGGIVADSRAETELQETMDKAAAMLRLLGDRTATPG